MVHATAETDEPRSGQPNFRITPGRIAFEGFYAKYPTFDGVAKQWDGSSEEIHDRWEDAANALIDRCAKSVAALAENPQELKLCLGDMSAEEMRTLRAGLKLVAWKLTALRAKAPE